MSDVKTLENMNVDDWKNVYSGMGDPRKDKQANTYFGTNLNIPETMLFNMYAGDGVVTRIVDAPADASVSKWFKLANDTGNVISKHLFKMNLKTYLSECLKWSRLFGGGIIVMVINDGGELDKPVNENNIIEIEGFHVYTRYEAIISLDNYYGDHNNPKFGQPEFYNVYPTVINTVKENHFKVHETRVLRLDGHVIPKKFKHNYEGWGQSIIERIYTQLKNTGTIDNAIPKIVTEKNIRIMKIKGYMNMMARNDINVLKSRLDMMDLSMDQSNTLMYDSEEEIDIMSQDISGLADIIEKYNEKLSAVSRIPISILFRTNKGLGSGGDDKLDFEVWQEHITDIQDKKLRPELNKLITYTMKSSKGPTGGKEIDGWEIEFNPLKTVSQKEEIETRKTQAEIDEKMIDSGVYTNKTVAKNRYGQGSYSYDTIVKEGDTPPPSDNEE